MTLTDGNSKRNAAGFRTKLFGAVMLVILGLTAFAIYLAQVRVTNIATHDLQKNFEDELSWLHKVQDFRRAVLAERVHGFSENPRIHAALEDDALDLLYPSAKDELRGFLDPAPRHGTRSLHARFCRFLDSHGAVIQPPQPPEVGELSAKAEAQLARPHLPAALQVGYLPLDDPSGIAEVAIAPIFSSETGEVISALLAGFRPFELAGKNARAGMMSGVWVDGRLDLPSVPETAHGAIAQAVSQKTRSGAGQGRLSLPVNGAPYLLFFKRLHSDSLFPPAYEICLYPLADSTAELHRAWWSIGAAGALLLAMGLVVMNIVAARFAKPVEQLAVDSETNRAGRHRAEAELATTSEALERSSRYSADASHQLKNPLAILRAGIEKLITHDGFPGEVYEELSTLLHQTFRLTGVIDDLLLLSRMDAGHLRIRPGEINLNRLMEGWTDDLNALPGAPSVKVEMNLAEEILVSGEERYATLIVQNLLENAQKYNRPGGRIEIAVAKLAGDVILTIGNTGRAIAREAQGHLFERFQTGSGVAGHGLGLNLARELARLHGGDLRLVRSQDDWTEFELRLPAAMPVIAQPATIP